MRKNEFEFKLRALEVMLSKRIVGSVSCRYSCGEVEVKVTCKDRYLGTTISTLDFMYYGIEILVDKIVSGYKSIILNEYFKEG